MSILRIDTNVVIETAELSDEVYEWALKVGLKALLDKGELIKETKSIISLAVANPPQ